MASLLGISMGPLAQGLFDDLAGCTAPVSLVVLGASFKLNLIVEKKKNILRICIGRLVAAPAIFLTIGFLMGIRGVSFVTLIGVLASPCAVSCFTMAQAMDSDYELAGMTVVLTSAFGCLTMFLWLFLFRTLGAF